MNRAKARPHCGPAFCRLCAASGRATRSSQSANVQALAPLIGVLIPDVLDHLGMASHRLDRAFAYERCNQFPKIRLRPVTRASLTALVHHMYSPFRDAPFSSSRRGSGAQMPVLLWRDVRYSQHDHITETMSPGHQHSNVVVERGKPARHRHRERGDAGLQPQEQFDRRINRIGRRGTLFAHLFAIRPDGESKP